MCDNLTIAPWGDVLLCEDNGELNHIRGISKKRGYLYPWPATGALNLNLQDLSSPHRARRFFVNIQENGDTLAITGPWDTLV